MRYAGFLLLATALARASYPVSASHSVERLANGNTLIADGGQPAARGRATEVDSLGRLVWAYLASDVPWLHSARRLPNGNTLFSSSNGDRVLEVGPLGDSVWCASDGLDYPNEAYRLQNGNTLITDRDHNRVVEVEPSGAVVWSRAGLARPHNGRRLPSGNTTICDSDANRVLELAPDGTIVWSYATGLSWPRGCQRLENGNTLICDSRNHRVLEVTPGGQVAWLYDDSLSTPYIAERLANGHTLISDTRLTAGSRVVEVDSLGNVIWRYPRTVPVLVETLWVVNPSSGCSLYTHVHRPAYAAPGNRVPGVVLVPGGNGFGSTYDQTGFADNIADDGFAVLHFDPDGRGLSTPYPENYCGYVQQDGLRECLRYLHTRPYVDTGRVGIFSQSYGITMASGAVARYADSVRVKFMLDFEGPSDRSQTCQDSGGHVPAKPDSEAFWLEREAGRFMRQVPCIYLRSQTEVDHNPRITDNRHCIGLIDSTTSSVHGGRGIAAWTRVNDSVMNPANRVYTISHPPAWIPEIQGPHMDLRHILYLHELADKEPGTAVAPARPAAAGRLRVLPNPFRGSATVVGGGEGGWRVHDVSGRCVRACSGNSVGDGLAAGVYYLTSLSGGTMVRVVKTR